MFWILVAALVILLPTSARAEEYKSSKAFSMTVQGSSPIVNNKKGRIFSVKHYADGKGKERIDFAAQSYKWTRLIDFNKKQAILIDRDRKKCLVSKLLSPQMMPTTGRVESLKQRVIAGYKCKGWLKRSVCPYYKYWLSEKFSLPLEFENHHNLGVYKYKVTSLKFDSPPAGLFDLPAGFEQVENKSNGQYIYSPRFYYN